MADNMSHTNVSTNYSSSTDDPITGFMKCSNYTDSFLQVPYDLSWYYPIIFLALGGPGNVISAVYICVLLWKSRRMPDKGTSPYHVYMLAMCVCNVLSLCHRMVTLHVNTLHVTVSTVLCCYLQFTYKWSAHLATWVLVLLR